MKTHSDRVYLEHILECAACIRGHASSGKQEFMNSSLLQDAVLRRLRIMAESTQRLSDALKAQAPKVDWRALRGFRNSLVRAYLGGIDLNQVWNAMESDLPELEIAARELIQLL